MSSGGGKCQLFAPSEPEDSVIVCTNQMVGGTGMKIILLRRKLLAVLACVLAAAAMFYVVNYPEVVSAAATKRQLPIYCVQRDQKMVAISFDAAWGDVRLRHPG